MAAVMLQVIPSFYKKNFQKTACLLLKTQMRKILCAKNTVLLATMISCASYPIADILLNYLETLMSY